MFKKTKEKTVKEYLDFTPDEKKENLVSLHKFIQKTIPKLKPYFASNMIGYGKFKYLNYKKQTVDWPVVALAYRKQYISIYVCSLIDGKYVAEAYKNKLGNVKVGKSCISLKSLEDINLKTLGQVLKLAAKNPGLRK